MAQELYQLPKGWEWKTLGNVCEKITDGSHNPPKGCDSGLPMLSSKNIQDGFIDWNDYRLIPKDSFEMENARTRIKPGDVLLTIVGTIGRSAVVLKGQDAFTLQRSVAVLSSEMLDPFFFSYQLRAPQLQNYFVENANGAAQKGIYLNQLKNTPVALPPLPEQKRIVAKLDALLSRIAQATQELQESLALADQLFTNALDETIRNSNESASIEDLAEIKGGKRLPKGHDLSDEPTLHPYIRVSDFNDYGSIDVDGVRYISEATHNEIKRYIINSDDLYISIAGTIGKTGIIPNELDGANLTENAAKLVIKDKGKLSLQYLYYYTKSRDFEEQAGLATKQVAQPKLALIRLAKIQIPMRPLLEQKRIVQRLEALQAKQKQLKETLNEKIAGLNALKASLLDAAFRGEL